MIGEVHLSTLRSVLTPGLPETELIGEHLRLSRVTESDVQELFSCLDHDEVWQHVPGRPSTADAYWQILVDATTVGRFPWVLRLQHDYAGLAKHSVVGTSSYLDVDLPNERCEIGFTSYTPAVWGTIVNPQAKLLLLGAAFGAGFGRVQLKTDARNLRSQRAIAGIGAAHEGVLRQYQRRTDGSMRDTVMFSVLADEWPRVRTHLEQRAKL